MTAGLVGTSGFAAIPTTALDLPLVQRLRRSPRFRVRVPIVAIVQAASGGSVDVISVIVWNSVRNSGRCCMR